MKRCEILKGPLEQLVCSCAVYLMHPPRVSSNCPLINLPADSIRAGDDETFQDIFRDFSNMASHDPERLSRRCFSRGGDDAEVEEERLEES